MFKTKRPGLLAALAILTILLVACQPNTVEVVKEVEVTRVITEEVEVTRVITETVVEEGKTVEVTRVVVEIQEVMVEPEPEEMMMPAKADPTVYTAVTFGDIDTMDPALAYDTASGQLIENVMEGLIYYNGSDGTSYVPALALEVPTVANGGISADGLTYTFNIREGVTYHEGGTLEPHDVAYTFQRGLLQSDPNSAQWLLLEPILGYSSGDVTEGIADGAYGGDPDGLKANITPEELAAVCEQVKAAVVADDAAGTVAR